MSCGELASRLAERLPDLRGRLQAGAVLAELTWFRVGGPAELLYAPADEADLAYFLAGVGRDVPITVVGLGSNLLVRDGGIDGVVIRLGRGFAGVSVEENSRIRAGTGVPDVKLARAAAEAGIAGFAFYRGIPGGIGGALRMNGGAHGTETKDRLIEVRALDRDGRIHVLSLADLNYSYRHCGASEELIFTQALFQGMPGDKAAILAEMDEVATYREENQPIKERTGGSTFKNPPGHSAWKLIDAAGCRGLKVGGAQMSTMHCNFMINVDAASAEDLERLGETVRARVLAHSGVMLDWEIKRLGRPHAGRPIGEALAVAA